MNNFERAGNNFTFTSPTAIILYFVLLKLLIHLLFNNGYGYFRDEFYYVACGEHLAWGYVDQPPMIALIAKITTFLFGKSLFALRIFPVIAGVLTVYLTGLMIRELGGNKLAIIIGLTAVVFSPVLLALNSTLSMNPFDVLFCTTVLYLITIIIKRGNDKLWIWVGVVAGIGLLNKISLFFIGFGVLAGLLFTENRFYFKSKYLWFGVLAAILIFLPHVIWQAANDFPTLKFMYNAAMYKNVSFSPLSFLGMHLLELNPASTLILLALISSLFIKKFKELRFYSWVYLAILILFLFTNAKPYYIAILAPTILSVGAVIFVKYLESINKRWIAVTIMLINIPFYILIVPFALPVLEPEDYIAYSVFTGISPAPAERQEMGPLPQHFADRFGWEDMAKEVSRVYLSLPENERENIVVFGQNYGEAGAIDFFRFKYPLPKAISNHNNYWIWNFPDNVNDSLMIVIGSNIEDNSEFFHEVVEAGRHFNQYGMPSENVGIFICRYPKVDLRNGWKDFKISTSYIK